MGKTLFWCFMPVKKFQLQNLFQKLIVVIHLFYRSGNGKMTWKWFQALKRNLYSLPTCHFHHLASSPSSPSRKVVWILLLKFACSKKFKFFGRGSCIRLYHEQNYAGLSNHIPYTILCWDCLGWRHNKPWWLLYNNFLYEKNQKLSSWMVVH